MTDLTTITSADLLDEIGARVSEDMDFEDKLKSKLFHLIDEAYEAGEIAKEDELREELENLETLDRVESCLTDAAFYLNNDNKPEFMLYAKRAMNDLDITVY